MIEFGGFCYEFCCEYCVCGWVAVWVLLGCCCEFVIEFWYQFLSNFDGVFFLVFIDRLTWQPNPTTRPPNLTTLMDGQQIESLETRLSQVGWEISPKPDPSDPCPPLVIYVACRCYIGLDAFTSNDLILYLLLYIYSKNAHGKQAAVINAATTKTIRKLLARTVKATSNYNLQ